MTAYSYNGWPASIDAKSLGVVPFVVAGVSFPGGVRGGDVYTVLHHVATEFNRRVEPLESPGCWGWSYRPNRNAANLSCHASATAIDCNAPQHPNGVEASKNFTDAQIKAVHSILSEIPELGEVVHWGGDWHAPALTPDPMHFEIHDHDLAKLARVAGRLTERKNPDMQLLADLDAARKKHGATRIQAVRVLLRALISKAGPIRAARLRTALAAVKGII